MRKYTQTFILLRSSGSFERVKIERNITDPDQFVDSRLFNDQVYKLLDCECYEHLTVAGSFGILLDESGKIKNPPKPPNILATKAISPRFDLIVGDVLFVKEGYLDMIFDELTYVGFDESELRSIEEFLLCLKRGDI